MNILLYVNFQVSKSSIKTVKRKPQHDKRYHALMVAMVQLLSHVRLLGPHGLQPARLLCPQNFLSKNTGLVFHFLLQRIFLTQVSNPGLLHCRQPLALQADSLPVEPRGKPRYYAIHRPKQNLYQEYIRNWGFPSGLDYLIKSPYSVQFFGPFFDWVIYFSGVELEELLVYF